MAASNSSIESSAVDISAVDSSPDVKVDEAEEEGRNDRFHLMFNMISNQILTVSHYNSSRGSVQDSRWIIDW
jgi:hypothetical protein